MFICSKCRNDQTHKSHLTINVNGKTLIESVKLYAMIIQTDIETSNTGDDDDNIKEEDAKEVKEDVSIEEEQEEQEKKEAKNSKTQKKGKAPPPKKGSIYLPS